MEMCLCTRGLEPRSVVFTVPFEPVSLLQTSLLASLSHIDLTQLRLASSPRDIFPKEEHAAREWERVQLNQSQPVMRSIPSPPSQHDPSISIIGNMDSA
ncbi:hypothetical protein HID58_018401 [Brassica napus]|uniref:Uncharacterized protein n=1 Tax=Brassica napus TaxID=3708 RepID=A0ABQ8D9V8_BRANA|nr:hypothetical protein HID58_018401 [Brassica napus]